MKKRFGELVIGTRFCFRAGRYEKVTAGIGRDEERCGNMFHAGTEVLVEEGPAPKRSRTRPPSAPPAVRRVERDRVCPSETYEALQRAGGVVYAAKS